jgi:hypothetical protein
VDKNMRTLKTLVIVMGLAVVIGATVLATLIMTRGSRLAGDGAGDGPGVVLAGMTPQAPPLKLALKLPVGARVLESRIAVGRLTLRAGLKSGGEAIFIFDAASGRLITRYDIMTNSINSVAPVGAR